MKIIYSNVEEFFTETNNEESCVVCGRKTNKLEINFEKSICSDECLLKFVNEYNFTISK